MWVSLKGHIGAAVRAGVLAHFWGHIGATACVGVLIGLVSGFFLGAGDREPTEWCALRVTLVRRVGAVYGRA